LSFTQHPTIPKNVFNLGGGFFTPHMKECTCKKGNTEVEFTTMPIKSHTNETTDTGGSLRKSNLYVIKAYTRGVHTALIVKSRNPCEK
jgi:hypothetical protein